MRTAQGVSARLAQRSWLDRDFILDLTQPASSPLPCEALFAPSGSGCVALASFCAPVAHAHREAIDLKILVDCSGSMAGDSITQSRAALHQVLSELNPTDQFTLSRFFSKRGTADSLAESINQDIFFMFFSRMLMAPELRERFSQSIHPLFSRRCIAAEFKDKYNQLIL
jgi:hypothetical protein